MSKTTSDFHSRLLLLSEPIAEILDALSIHLKRAAKYPPKIYSCLCYQTLRLLAYSLKKRVSLRSKVSRLLVPFSLLLDPPLTNYSHGSQKASQLQGNQHFRDFSGLFSDSPDNSDEKLQELVVDSGKVRLVIELLPIVLPELKDSIEGSSIGKNSDAEDVPAAMARKPVGYAILAAHQLRWFVTQVEKPNLAKFCNLVVPCALTALDHWSPEVKGQGMISFVHLAKNVRSGDLGSYGDAVLDACCQNIALDDAIWIHVIGGGASFVVQRVIDA